ncbi:xylulokinase [Patescibacteria group bacterium]|nr:xylulokinase [Patescibacteria group bacterium]
MKEKYILAHDLGTTGNKAALYSSSGKLIASAFYHYGTQYPQVNWAEQNPQDWWQAVCISTRNLLSSAKISKQDVTVISFSGQMMGCLPVDKKGNPLRSSIIWADQRSIRQTEDIKKNIGEDKVYRITGHRISPTYSAAKIMWVRDNQREIFDQTYKFLHAKDYIIYKLTGKFVTDYSDASGMNLFDINKKQWSEKMLNVTKIPLEKLPSLHTSIDVAGEVTKKAGEEISLKAGTPVVLGGGDGPCAAVGSGAVKEGSCYNYIGSSSWIALSTKKPIYDPQRRTFTFCHLDPEMFMPAGTMQSAGGAYQWLKENICQIESCLAEKIKIDPYEIMDLKAESVEPGSGNLLFLPYLMGERSPYWNPNAKGVWIGLTLTHKKAHLIRSVLEGIAFNLRIILNVFEEQGAHIKEVKVIGGGAKGRLLRQIMADVYNKRILRPFLLEEATSLGAAIAGGIGIGIFNDFTTAEKLIKVVEVQEPRLEIQEKYEKLYCIFKDTYQALIPIYEQLASVD